MEGLVVALAGLAQTGPSAALKARFPTGAPVQVQVRNLKGKAVVDFKGIPLEQVSKLVEALTAELPPVPEAPRQQG